MRYDLRIMWVEDMPKWYKETKEIVEMDIEDECLTADINYINDGQILLDRLKVEQQGFKLYDIFFIDYSLSNGVVGSNIIKELRKMNIDSDILFYSSDKEEVIRKEITDDLGSFEGVYIANRTNFRDKSLFLLKKNSRRLLSLSNIRGLLTDQTSENDYIIISYLHKKYDDLTSYQKDTIKREVLDYMLSKQTEYENKSKREIENIENNGIKNINKFLKLPSYLVPIDLKYKIFKMIIEFNGSKAFDNNSIEDYIGKIINLRNTVAHKKLDICRMQKNILYYDNINQFFNRRCPEDCKEHNCQFKISVDQWKDVRKQIIEYGACFDAILEDIMREFDSSGEVAANIQC